MGTDNQPGGASAFSIKAAGYVIGGAVASSGCRIASSSPSGTGMWRPTFLASIRTQAKIDQVVHAALTIIFGCLATIMFVFASRLGPWRLPVLLGLVGFSAALVLTVLAAMIDGFIIPALAFGCEANASGSCIAENMPLLRLQRASGRIPDALFVRGDRHGRYRLVVRITNYQRHTPHCGCHGVGFGRMPTDRPPGRCGSAKSSNLDADLGRPGRMVPSGGGADDH